MDDLKKAYETLGLPEDASREQVEQRYFLLLKKARSRQVELDEINRAYKQIIGHEAEKDAPQEKQSKLSYFFYYYKIHVIAAILIILVTAFTVKGCIDRKNEEANKPPLDVTVTMYGNYFSFDGSDPKLSENLLRLMPEWKRIDVGIAYVPREIKSQEDMAMQQKAMLTLMTEKLDLMVLDEPNFDLLAKQGAFLPLDSLSDWPELNIDASRVRSAVAEETTAERPYGVDMTGNPVFQGSIAENSGEKTILAIRAQPAHPEKAERLFRLLVSSR
ncbi:hypothetical protein [Cohnella caldifontis]|uniref:hypothetical protein n=1 Tax=Cohnella caldifontis TaxID=3027471 RepID=UPI0023EBBAC1|nr:hypothetical protein [Cohnella sp. YIM B05605]